MRTFLGVLWFTFWIAMVPIVIGLFHLGYWADLYISVPYGFIAGWGAVEIAT